MFPSGLAKAPSLLLILFVEAALPTGGEGLGDQPRTKQEEQEKGAPRSGEGKSEEKKPGVPGDQGSLSIDEAYVRDNLKKHLLPSSLEILKDGRVKVVFNLILASPRHAELFRPKVSSSESSKFRWAHPAGGRIPEPKEPVEGLEWVPGLRAVGGLKMANDGQATLECWFTDDVEVKAVLTHAVNHSPKQTFALVFTDGGDRAVGNNFGTQAAIFRGGRVESAKGTMTPNMIWSEVDYQLIVKGGTCEARRNEEAGGKLTYSRRTFASGKVGFIWGGGIANVVTRLEITGRLDAKKMAAEIRKATKG